MQKLQGGKAVLASRICRQSLGIICKMLYNPNVHLGQTTIKDPIDGKRYVDRQIDWLIKAVLASRMLPLIIS